MRKWHEGDGTRLKVSRTAALVGEMQRMFPSTFAKGEPISAADRETIERAFIGPKWTQNELAWAFAEWANRCRRKARV